MVRKSTPAERMSSITWWTSSRCSPSPTITPDLVKIVRILALDALEQPQRGIIARAGPDRRIEPRHRLEIVIVDVGPGRDDRLDRRLAACCGNRGSGSRSSSLGVLRRSASITLTNWLAPPSGRSSRSTEVTTICSRPSSAAAIATCSGSSGSTARGMPVLTLQKAQARVQVSPRIITVACFLVQHSPMFGQAASSHTVARLSARISLRVSA